jgi:hypothetical protein
VLAPVRAEAMAAVDPAEPEPTTMTSKEPMLSRVTYWPPLS